MTMKCILMMSSLILYGFYYLIKYVDWKFHKQQLNNFLELFFVGCAINATVINKVPVFNGKNLFQYLFKIDTEYAITKCTIFIHSLKINKTIPKHWPLIQFNKYFSLQYYISLEKVKQKTYNCTIRTICLMARINCAPISTLCRYSLKSVCLTNLTVSSTI